MGDLEGVLEPCGCTSRPAGGLDRVTAAVRSARAGSEPAVLIAAGNVYDAADAEQARQQDRWRLELLAALLGELRPDAVVPGPFDSQRSSARLRAWLDDSAGAPALLGDPIALPGAVRGALLERANTSLGLSFAHLDADDPSRALAALREELTRLRARGARFTLAFVHGADSDAIARFAASGAADAVIRTGGTASEPDPPVIVGARTWLADAGRHGEHLLELELWPDRGERALGARQLELGHDAPRDPAVRGTLDQLFRRINAFNAEHVAPATAPRGETPGYVGAQSCAACHTGAYAWWRSTGHGRAYRTLVARGRQLDLDCVACHVTGFEQPGGATLGDLDRLQGVGCESCHGAGAAHADNPRSKRATVRRAVPQTVCVGCHDREHSPGFAYDRARSQLLVTAHGAPVRRH